MTVLVPVPKGNKDASNSSNYHPIALSSTFSKIIERSILINYESFFSTSPLQFGFKPGHSTSLCTATVKNVISRYLHNGSPVLGCFLDASKAFDLVDHDILFKTLLDRGLPLPIVRFLLSWYGTQKMRVRWDSSFSESFSGFFNPRACAPSTLALKQEILRTEGPRPHHEEVGKNWQPGVDSLHERVDSLHERPATR